MLFHTWVFFVFFLIVFPVYLLVRRNNEAMNFWLMVASYTFYGWWNPWLLLLLFGTSAIDYAMVLLMERKQSTRKLWLIISLVSNFGFLGFFKYSKFIVTNINALLVYLNDKLGAAAILQANQLPQPEEWVNFCLRSVGSLFGHQDDWFISKIILPIGISFHTFQSMSYTIDAYFGTIKTERSFVRFLTFVSFFPQLVAGPIERAHHLLPQLQSTPAITLRGITDGLSLFLVGFFKKVALADYLALYVNDIYAAPDEYPASALVLATVAFGWQIYFDFSGYTDMARGVAEIMGFRLMLNFNNPYTAVGLGDFWNRWHISLSTWFKDYVYFPLGGSRGGKWLTYRNMFITMVVSGIWHGAEWGFVIWGLLHAVGRCLTRELELTRFYSERIPRLIKQMAVFAFVTFTWIFFRAQTVEKSWLIVERMFTAEWADPQFPLLLAGMVLAVWLYQLLFSSQLALKRVLDWRIVKLAVVVFMIVYLLVVAQPSTNKFIYFEF